MAAQDVHDGGIVKRLAIAVVLLALLGVAGCGEEREVNELTEYRVLLSAEDGAGTFLITLRIAAEGPEQAAAQAKEWARSQDARLLEIDEIEPKQPVPGTEPGVVQKTGRAYYESD